MSSDAEMTMMVHEAALSAPTSNWKDRVLAAARLLNLPFPRAKAFYYREPRRVTAEEMDNARAAIRDLRAQRRERKTTEHLAWLNSTLASLRASSDPDFHSDDISRLERVLARVGALDSAVGDPSQSSNGADQ